MTNPMSGSSRGWCSAPREFDVLEVDSGASALAELDAGARPTCSSSTCGCRGSTAGVCCASSAPIRRSSTCRWSSSRPTSARAERGTGRAAGGRRADHQALPGRRPAARGPGGGGLRLDEHPPPVERRALLERAAERLDPGRNAASSITVPWLAPAAREMFSSISVPPRSLAPAWRIWVAPAVAHLHPRHLDVVDPAAVGDAARPRA